MTSFVWVSGPVQSTLASPVVAISDERVPSAIGWFLQYPGVSHKPFAFHLFFNETPRRRRWFLAKDETSNASRLDRSVSLRTESK